MRRRALIAVLAAVAVLLIAAALRDLPLLAVGLRAAAMGLVGGLLLVGVAKAWGLLVQREEP